MASLARLIVRAHQVARTFCGKSHGVGDVMNCVVLARTCCRKFFVRKLFPRMYSVPLTNYALDIVCFYLYSFLVIKAFYHFYMTEDAASVKCICFVIVYILLQQN